MKGMQEKQLWSQLTAACMSDEETDDDIEGTFIVHKPVWRSDLLNRFIEKLGKRYQDGTKKCSYMKLLSTRRVGSPSSRSRPKTIPKWAQGTHASSSEFGESSASSGTETPVTMQPSGDSSSSTGTETPVTVHPSIDFEESSRRMTVQPSDELVSDFELSDVESDEELHSMIRRCIAGV